jgi:hypothetical protein
VFVADICGWELVDASVRLGDDMEVKGEIPISGERMTQLHIFRLRLTHSGKYLIPLT